MAIALLVFGFKLARGIQGSSPVDATISRAHGYFSMIPSVSRLLAPTGPLLATWLGATHFLAHVQHTSKPLPFASHVPKVSQNEKSAIHGELTAAAEVYAIFMRPLPNIHVPRNTQKLRGYCITKPKSVI